MSFPKQFAVLHWETGRICKRVTHKQYRKYVYKNEVFYKIQPAASLRHGGPLERRGDSPISPKVTARKHKHYSYNA